MHGSVCWSWRKHKSYDRATSDVPKLVFVMWGGEERRRGGDIFGLLLNTPVLYDLKVGVKQFAVSSLP